jgi:hypothetical protein
VNKDAVLRREATSLLKAQERQSLTTITAAHVGGEQLRSIRPPSLLRRPTQPRLDIRATWIHVTWGLVRTGTPPQTL